jgi:hypothetical protein
MVGRFATAVTASADLDKAVEIDPYPNPQDLRRAHARGKSWLPDFIWYRFTRTQLRLMTFAAASTVRAGINHDRILNFMGREALLMWVRSVWALAKN